jgi:hypothetical protein
MAITMPAQSWLKNASTTLPLQKSTTGSLNKESILVIQLGLALGTERQAELNNI